VPEFKGGTGIGNNGTIPKRWVILVLNKIKMRQIGKQHYRARVFNRIILMELCGY